MAAPKTITAKELTALTSLTDQRHRQLAKEGFFPPPIKGQYQLSPTISGMFRHFKASSQQNPLNRERMLKLQVERQLIEMQIEEKSRELIPASEFLEVARRGFQAITATIMAQADLAIERREDIIKRVREAAESIAAVPGDV